MPSEIEEAITFGGTVSTENVLEKPVSGVACRSSTVPAAIARMRYPSAGAAMVNLAVFGSRSVTSVAGTPSIVRSDA